MAERGQGETIRCARCHRDGTHPVGRAPFQTDLGRRVAEEICADCWEAWKRQQMLLINHYGLNVLDPNARAFLLTNMKSFLFAEGPPDEGPPGGGPTATGGAGTPA